MTRRYCRAFTSRYPFGNGADLVYSAVSGGTATIPAKAAAWIQACSRFQTLEGHSAFLGQGAKDRNGQIVETLRQWAEKGLLVSDEKFLAHCRQAARQEDNPPAIATIGATTRARPELLERGFASFLRSAKEFGRDHDYVVVDDGVTADEQSSTRQVLQKLAREHGAAVRYCGREERASFADAVAAEADVPAEVVRFALLGDATSAVTTGAARNSLLLDTVGDLYLLVDDDSVCRVARCPDGQTGVALDARTNPTELWFFADRDAMLRETQFVDEDPLGLHETILGRRVADCLPPVEQVSDLDLSYTTADFAQHLWRNAGRVLATSGGVVGDSGMGSTAYLVLPPDSHRRLVRSEQDYVAAVVNRQILRAPLRTTITRGTFCVGACLGLDNRVLLPPFVPVGRNSDGLFARTLQRCFRDGYKGYLPWAVLHDPLPARVQTLEGAEADAARIRLTHILRVLIVPAEFTQSGDPAEDLRRLGEEITEIASQPASDFQQTVRPRLVKAASMYLEGIQQALKAADGPEFYARRQRDHWDRLSRALTTEEYFVPRDVGANGSAEEGMQAAQQAVLRFGQVLAHWTAIVTAAKALRERGVRLARPV